MSSNLSIGKQVSFETWLNSYPEKVRGFMSVYSDQPFDYDKATSGYELGRQLAVMAKLDGLRRSDLVRKRPKIEAYAFTKTKMPRLEQLAIQAGFFRRGAESLFGNG
jgi:hypothetical protein